MDFDVYSIIVITAIALAVLALVQPISYTSPSLSAIYRYWPQYYNYTLHGDLSHIEYLTSGMTCWLYINGSWIEISRGGRLGLSITVLNLTCR